jgi:Tol biopolymer transport system component
VYSPDGAWIVFSSNQSGNLDLWAVSPASGAIRRLTDHPAEDWDPAFTPDGQLLWSSNRTGNFEVWRAAADGSGARQVTNDGFDAQNPTATPDGWVVYASGNPRHAGIWKVRLDGSGARRLVTEGRIPEVSPDGRYVSYRRPERPRRVEVAVARVDEGTKVFEIAIYVHRPTPSLRLGRTRWLPGGRQIAFVGQNLRGQTGVFVQDFVPGRDTHATRRPLGGFEGDEMTESFGISADGTRLVLARWTQNHSLMMATGVPGIAKPGGRLPAQPPR